MAVQLDVVLVNPFSRNRVYQSLGLRLSAIENPVWAGLIATYCRLHDLNVEIIDAEALEMSATEVATQIVYLKPKLVVVVVYGHQPSASTQVMTGASEVCSSIKQRRAEQPILLLGGHVAALPERTLCEEQVDFVATGEGLHTVVELVQALSTPNPDVTKVRGLCLRQNEIFIKTEEIPLLGNLDENLPGIAWDLLPMDRYRSHNWHCLDGSERQPYAAIYTTLGCPFHCSFCCIQAPFKRPEAAAGYPTSTNSYRYWTPKHVISQIDFLVTKYGVRNLKIADEMFILNRRHVLQICDLLIQRKYNLNIWAYSRLDTIRDDMLPKLREAGFRWLALGIESGDSSVRSGIHKFISEETIYRVIEEAQRVGIHIIGNYIFGLPDDTHDTMKETLRLAVDLNCEFANFYSAMAYPGSALYHQALNAEVPLPSSWSGYSQHSYDCLPLPTRYIPAREVLAFRDYAFQHYFESDRYLNKITSIFGDSGRKTILEMTKVKLKRGLLDGSFSVPSVLFPASSETSKVQQLGQLHLISN